MSVKILVIEDDFSIRQAVVEELTSCGWHVEQAMDGELGLQLAETKAFDLLILDIMLPRIHGYEICKHLRLQGKAVPIIMMSALGEEKDVLRGFEAGTTDYIRKPFSLAELVMRIKVHIGPKEDRHYQFSGYSLDTQTRTLTLPDHSQTSLTDKENRVLVCLIQKTGTVFNRKTLLNQGWGNDWALGERSIDRCIKTLRKKLQYSETATQHLKTIRNIGYTWVENISE